jgi:hypothetical protein
MNAITKFLFASAVVGGVGLTQAALVSDFNTTTSVDAFTRKTILDTDAVKESSITAPSGAVFATKTNTGTAVTGAEQSVYAQTFAVAPGETLRADYSFGAAAAAGSGTPYADFGLFLGAPQTDVGTTGTTASPGSTRANYVAIYGNNQTGDVKTVGAIGASGTSVATTFVVAGKAVAATGLYITRGLDGTTYSVGYVDNLGVDTFVKSYAVTSGASFTDVGFFSDLRGATTTLASLDNLRVVPEPTALAVLGLGAAACLRRRRA